MAKKVIMPKFGMDQEEGTVSHWIKQEGDEVEKGEPILEVETDKVNMEVEAMASGILAGIRVGPGDTVPIGEVIAYILKPGEELPAKAKKPVEQKAEAASQSKAEAKPVAKTETAVRATPVAEKLAESHGIDLASITAREGERITRADVEEHLSQQVNGQAAEPQAGDKVRAVPAARRLARELGVDLASIEGSGPQGRIQSTDVEEAAQAQPAAPQAPAVPALADRPGMPAIKRQVPLTGMRKTIAERLTASVREIPQFTVSMAVEMHRALEMVEDLRAASDEVRVTLTAVLVKACAWALKRHPNVNASFGAEGVTEWADINVGVAVAVEAGLLVPVVHQADSLGAVEVAKKLTDLGARAKEGKLQPQDMQGGTFTISNLGMFGVDRFTAIINPPQAAILAVSRAEKRPVVTENDELEIKLLADFTLTADHRIVDGASAAQFLRDVKQALEKPGVML